MIRLPALLAIALWFVLSVWAVGIAAYVFDFPGEYVWVAFIVGVGAALFESQQIKARHD